MKTLTVKDLAQVSGGFGCTITLWDLTLDHVNSFYRRPGRAEWA
ncbi:bacteriocin [Neisseria chenwenguii]|uniref:Uncharacterized protein n=1 Tax=Neisseria chenwenguii TaxID=1853278 RepID=A0A220RYY5_9NEIS|nr:bacteriocin [Neisseria chenwenguii]ASK26363.1 hypothetical protein BG910_00135 [Neisseria chenwenguii]ROV55785.1 bacteriocin [Neisseria chenwenguii]